MEGVAASHKAELESALSQLQSELRQKQLDHEAALTDLKSLQSKHAEAQTGVERSQNDLRDAQQTMLKLQEELKTATEQAEAAASSANTSSAGTNTGEVEQLSRTLKQIQTELADTQEALKMSQLSFQENLEQTNKLHEAELAVREEARVRAEAELKEATSKQHAQLETLKSQLDSLKRESAPRPGSAASDWSSSHPHPPMSPSGRSNGSTADQELVSLHNAHNAKLAEKDSELERERAEKKELQDTVDRLKFELSMHEQDREE